MRVAIVQSCVASIVFGRALWFCGVYIDALPMRCDPKVTESPDMNRPKFDDLTPAQQQNFGNGVGPYWLPDWARALITDTASWFFADASWRHHDFGYVVGGDRFDRARADWKFLRAMAKDAISQPRLWLLSAPLAIVFAVAFYVAVRIGGQFGSFEYRDTYATLDDIIAAYAD